MMLGFIEGFMFDMITFLTINNNNKMDLQDLGSLAGPCIIQSTDKNITIIILIEWITNCFLLVARGMV
jgi:hypothetical protein